jgi:hypothetical protein
MGCNWVGGFMLLISYVVGSGVCFGALQPGKSLFFITST